MRIVLYALFNAMKKFYELLNFSGKGRCYSYDSVGHKGEGTYMSTGSAFALMAPLLDNQVREKKIF